MNYLNHPYIIQDDETELLAYIKQNAQLLDVRTPEEFNAGSVPNALHIPMHEIPYRYEELNKEKPLIVFCRTGSRSEQVKHFLKQYLDFKQVLNGGAWQILDRLVREGEEI